MATAIMFMCNCGKGYQVYIPKAILMGQWMGQPGDWAEVDQEEEAQGEISLAKKMCEMTNSTFIDLREQERVLCPGCGGWIDFYKLIRETVTTPPEQGGPWLTNGKR